MAVSGPLPPFLSKVLLVLVGASAVAEVVVVIVLLHRLSHPLAVAVGGVPVSATPRLWMRCARWPR